MRSANTAWPCSLGCIVPSKSPWFRQDCSAELKTLQQAHRRPVDERLVRCRFHQPAGRLEGGISAVDQRTSDPRTDKSPTRVRASAGAQLQQMAITVEDRHPIPAVASVNRRQVHRRPLRSAVTGT